MIVSRFLRIRIIIFLFSLLMLWLIYYYSFRSSNALSIKGTTGVADLIPEMTYGIMNEEVPKVKITVFYECLCPDSRSFFVNQLLPVMEAIPAYLSTDLVPYGKASTEVISDGLYKFTCQHGSLECLGNKIHACALERTKDDLTKVKIVTCMIKDNYNPQDIGKKCCEMYNVNWENIQHCAFGAEGNELLKKYGDVTLAVVPKISFIPTILLNKDRSNQTEILKDLWSVLCAILKKVSKAPKECK